MVNLLLAVIYLAFISLGLPDALLGAAWPGMCVEFNVPVSYAGLISIVISAGTTVSSLLSDRLTRRFGTARVTAKRSFTRPFCGMPSVPRMQQITAVKRL